MRITEELVRSAVSADDPWHLGNSVLYELCRKHPGHKVTSEIVAKVWLIGRAYSAALERGRSKAESASLSNDKFYTDAMPKVLQGSGLDGHLKQLRRLNRIDVETAPQVLAAHGCLVEAFRFLTRKDKRSLASKYLHFHLPNLFFIYDSRAATTIARLGVDPVDVDSPAAADHRYAKFVGAAVGIRRHVSSEFGYRLTPRQLDRLLLAVFENQKIRPRS